MSIGFTSYRIADQNAMYFLTFATVGWVDVFTRKSYKDVLIDSLKHCQEYKGLELYSYVIMTNHVHLVARAKEGFLLSDILRDFKKYTSKTIIKKIKEEPESRREWLLKFLSEAGSRSHKNTNYQLWRNDNHPIELYSEKVTNQKIDYIHYNPVEEGIVEKEEDYLYSSAKSFYGGKGLLELEEL